LFTKIRFLLKLALTFCHYLTKSNHMKLLKPILIALVVLAIAGTIAVYFLPNQYSVSNSIEINQRPDVIYAQLYDFNKWGTWDPWMEADPEAKVTIEGSPGAPGHKMSWDGKKSGMGSMTLVASGANQFVYSQLDFIKPFKAQAKDKITLEANGDKTKVTWTNTGGLAFPFGRLFGLSVDKMLGADQRKGLDKLKKYTEAIPAPVPVAEVADSTAKSI
jgi:hypothetical protein